MAKPFYFYVWTLAQIRFPWTLLLFFLPWRRLVNRSARTAVMAARGGIAGSGAAWLWCALLPEILLIFSFHYKLPISVLIFFGPVAVLIWPSWSGPTQRPCAGLR